jgi:hypothetical protein
MFPFYQLQHALPNLRERVLARTPRSKGVRTFKPDCILMGKRNEQFSPQAIAPGESTSNVRYCPTPRYCLRSLP